MSLSTGSTGLLTAIQLAIHLFYDVKTNEGTRYSSV